MRSTRQSLHEICELAEKLPLVPDDADLLVAEGIAATERGDEIEQEELFAKWRAKYG